MGRFTYFGWSLIEMYLPSSRYVRAEEIKSRVAEFVDARPVLWLSEGWAKVQNRMHVFDVTQQLETAQ